MQKKIKHALILLSGIILGTTLILTVYQTAESRYEIKKVLLHAENLSSKKFNPKMVKDLPAPVRRYFLKTIREQRSFVSTVRLKHSGEFKTSLDGEWGAITGEEYFSAVPPAYIWKGSLGVASAKDLYIDNSGRLAVYLLSAFRIINATGPQYDQGELLRWLTENVWFPSSFLSNENIIWKPVDNNTAQLLFSHNGVEIKARVDFNDRDEIISFEAERFMDKKRKEIWSGTCSDYRETDGYRIPYKIEASWKLKDGIRPYARFVLVEIEYDVPASY